MMKQQIAHVREAVGVFDSYNALQGTIRELEISGFGRRQISVLGSEQAMKKQFGKPQVNPKKLEDSPKAPRSANIAEEELGVAQGVLVGGGMLTGVVAALLASSGLTVPSAILTAALAGTGGLAAGGVLARVLGERYAEFFQKQIDKGGLVLWVQTPDGEKERKAQAILKKNGAHDVHVHEMPIAA